MKRSNIVSYAAGSILMIGMTIGVSNVAVAENQISDPVVIAARNSVISTQDNRSTLNMWDKELSSKGKEIAATIDTGLADYDSWLTDTEKDTLNTIKTCIESADTAEILNKLSSDAQAIIDQASARKTKAEEAEAAAQAAAVAASYSTTTTSSSSYAAYVESYNSGNYSGSYYDFLRDGVVYSEGKKFTYYSQSVLPGGGLDIPGRHTDGGFVKDGDGYICIASDKENGTVVDTPWGQGKVYDSGVSGEHYDVYVE